MGVSTGTSYSSAPHDAVNAAHTTARPASASLASVFLLSHAVIDFLEQIVVLADLRVVRLELQRLVVRLARLVEQAFVFVRDREIVVGGGVLRIELDGL